MLKSSRALDLSIYEDMRNLRTTKTESPLSAIAFRSPCISGLVVDGSPADRLQHDVSADHALKQHAHPSVSQAPQACSLRRCERVSLR